MYELPGFCPVCEGPSLPDREECRECAEWADKRDLLAEEETARDETTLALQLTPEENEALDNGIDWADEATLADLRGEDGHS